ncbi:hypothetical protein [Pseudomonas gingeri]|uniref:DUF4175 domain-containing protein n=1 Tax=Pseudomonas gingeri TaxID=117681 RepID=A0A7Y7Y6U1_9PSED|nr:hypothetical protein [Pseudomonas gingeri]NWA01952.1 hypothetical protein [Pseudomonas gingeri]NWA17960.1 hypothetical protein [Pseudomonas gingeri]NWA53385.1 hypothetical protein [Pseudomonas gingeri]NWA95302.1 hypothetical protein [Pseudomonas gingeri]NWB00250.1 hypothetical protein [Pseudomonas gingeri]
MKPRQSNFWKVFSLPTVIAVLTAIGLFAALLGDGAWDALSWLGLGIPTLIAVQALLRSGPRKN